MAKAVKKAIKPKKKSGSKKKKSNNLITRLIVIIFVLILAFFMIFSVFRPNRSSQEVDSLLTNVINIYYKEELEKIAILKRRGCL